MEQEGRVTSANRSERTLVRDEGRAAAGPRFDEKSIQRARPAVPLGGARANARRINPLVILVVCVGLLGVAAGAVGTYFYQRRPPEQPTVAATRASEAAAPATAATDNVAAVEPAPSAGEEELFKPKSNDLPDVAPPAPQEAPRASVEGAGSAPAEIRPAGGAPPAPLDELNEQATLRAALAEWVGATNARDIRRQMEFYHPRLDAYYLSRDTPARAVRAEKERVFGRATSIGVRASGAAIRFSPDGRTATMRFRKSYEIGGGGEDRRGEVVQELRWRRTGQGWKIVSERDVRVLQ